jgi:hypothetical protein
MPIFNPYPELASLTGLVLIGLIFGLRYWRSRGVGMVLCCLLVLMLVGIGMWLPGWGFRVPLAWLLAGRRECFVLGFVFTVFTCGLMKVVRSALLRGVIISATVLATAFFCFIPVAGALWGYAAGLTAVHRVDKHGVCHQSSGLSCGPAAAVTVLGRLGWDHVSEREVGLACGTSRFGGTPADVLAETLRDAFGPQLEVNLIYRDSVSDLPALGPLTGTYALAVVKFAPMVDHFVAVLDVDLVRKTVTLGDPLAGWRVLSILEFEETWKGVAMVLTGKPR